MHFSLNLPFNDLFLDTFLMVAGGFGGGYKDDVEVLSLDPADNPVPWCLTNLRPFPVPFYWASSATLLPGKESANDLLCHVGFTEVKQHEGR